jgi:ABC-type transporter lipoprotein component MlaA
MSPADTASTRVLSDEITVDGDTFGWWAVGNGPVLVTVSHPILGKKADFTRDNPKEFAVTLAMALLRQQ